MIFTICKYGIKLRNSIKTTVKDIHNGFAVRFEFNDSISEVQLRNPFESLEKSPCFCLPRVWSPICCYCLGMKILVTRGMI
ncbi:hypothetical protein GYH30_026316 [Glycine max]|nr:hypothetical protein GYH30_026316 [Glycine max]